MKTKKSNDIIQKLAFYSVIRQRIKTEESEYATLLFQENIIQKLLIASLRGVELISNKKGNGILKNIKFDFSSIENKTLGSIAGILTPFLTTNKNLRDDIKKFIKVRNSITHKMLDEQYSEGELNKNLSSLINTGNKVISSLESLNKELIDQFLEKV